jgi:hypothetical protein
LFLTSIGGREYPFLAKAGIDSDLIPMGPVEFYDLEEDPGETRNLAASDHPVLRCLRSESGRYIREALELKAKKSDREGVELSEQERLEADEALRTLGYIKWP